MMKCSMLFFFVLVLIQLGRSQNIVIGEDIDSLKLIMNINQRVEKDSTVMPYIIIDDTELFVYFHGAKDYESSMDKLYEYIKENIHYPDSARREGIEGKVYVSFVIDENGNVATVKLIKGVSAILDNEVLRVVSGMPLWNWDKKINPIHRKKVMKCIPVSFSLSKRK